MYFHTLFSCSLKVDIFFLHCFDLFVLFAISGYLQCELSRTYTVDVEHDRHPTEQLSAGTLSEVTSTNQDDSSEPPTKRFCSALFSHYRPALQRPTGIEAATKQLNDYIMTINSSTFDQNATENQMNGIWDRYPMLQKLFQRVFCTPASSAPVERIFSQSGLLMTARRANMSNVTLESLVFMKCNQDI